MESRLREYLGTSYEGVFDASQFDRHIQVYIGLEIAQEQVALVAQSIGNGRLVLDVGSGFGSFVLAARQQGLDATGVEIAEFEIEYARERLVREIPSDDPERVYPAGNGLDLQYESNTFDAVTLWNVLEHLSDYERLLAECVRVLRPGGILHVVCPNYAAFRDEAHYHVFWPSLIPRRLAAAYLRLRGKNPRFFETGIFYRTNWGVLSALYALGLDIHDYRLEKLRNPEAVNNPRMRALLIAIKKMRLLVIAEFILALSFVNPFKDAISLYARKRSPA